MQFPWEREGKNDEIGSCWLRVATARSGNGFGAQFIPRIGQEVVVSFIDGDPDKPLITGCVYNGANALPYALPANQTQSGIKTHSEQGFNELRFDDKRCRAAGDAGAEGFSGHRAERQYNHRWP